MLRSWWFVVIVCTALTADAGPVVEKPMAAINGEPEPYTIRISCGSVVDVISHVPRETVWSADYGYLGGVSVNNTPDDSNIIVPPLPTRRTFPSRGGCYLFTGVPRRHYSIRAFLGVDPEALFDISVQGMQVTSLPRDWIDSDNHLFVETLLFVLDGSVSICFNASHGDPSVVSLEVLEVDYQAYHHGPRIDESLFLKTIIRVSCGSGKIIFDPQDTAGDRIWLDALTFGGDYQKPISTNKNIQKSSAPPNFYPEIIYKSAIVGAALDFTVDVDPNANYSLWFHFAELDDSITSIGQRLFDVVVNDVVIFEDVDVLNLTGESFSALALDARVYVDSKSLRIRFRGKNGAQAIISALEVMQIVQEGLHSGSQPKHSSIATICIVIGLFPLIVLLMRG